MYISHCCYIYSKSLVPVSNTLVYYTRLYYYTVLYRLYLGVLLRNTYRQFFKGFDIVFWFGLPTNLCRRTKYIVR